MLARVWGCRGSLPTPGPQTVTYGGNTSCLELRLADGSLVVLDAGTGARFLGDAISGEAPTTIHVLLTHLHLDHIEGLRFFRPLWNPQNRIQIWGPSSPTMSLEKRLAKHFSPPLYPLQISDITSDCTFHDLPEEPWKIGSATFSAATVEHPGPTMGIRIEEDGHVLAYIPDHEPALDSELENTTIDWVSGSTIADGAEVLIHDAQYTTEEYRTRISWGHSSTEDAVTFGRLCGAQKLMLFHHDPYHSDTDLERIGEHARVLWGDNGEGPTLAREGQEIFLGEAPQS